MAAMNSGITCSAFGCDAKESLVIPVKSVDDIGISHSGEMSCSHSQIGAPFLTKMAPISMMRIPEGEFTVSVSMTTASAMAAFILNSANESRPSSPACDSPDNPLSAGTDDCPLFFFDTA